MSAAVEFAVGQYSAAIHARLDRFDAERFGPRLWRRDATLWGDDPAHQQVAANRLGWLGAPDQMKGEVAGLRAFAAEVAAEGFTHAVLLGMGGSSLAPEVFRLTFGVRAGGLELTVLDNTSPAAVRAVAEAHDPRRTLLIVSSKSGGTVEVLSFEKYFYEWTRAARGETAGRAFVAVTDPGTSLERLAATRGYRRVFVNPPDIGGRYSALSFFGLLPAVLIGVDLEALLASALEEAEAARRDVSSHQVHGLELGAALGELALGGRDKVTLVLGHEIAAFGSWAEQLLAESTGKQGRGLVPVADEPLGPPGFYGDDRVFVGVGIQGDPTAEARLDALRAAGHPVLRWRLPALESLGAEFLRWEIATAAAGAVLGVDPFDEPNVTEAKQATQAVLERFLAEGSFARHEPLAAHGYVAAYGPAEVARALRSRVGNPDAPEAWATALLSLARSRDYVALLAYLHRTPERHERLERLRIAAQSATRLATTLGYGPRFLHSTGQLHKGGPNTGLFLMVTADEGEELPIPGERYGFGALRYAQAAGDYQVLERHGRRVIRLHLGPNVERALDDLIEAVAAAGRV